MRNILDFLLRIRFFLLFAFLEVIAISLVFRHSGYQQSVMLSASSSFTGRIQERFNNVVYYFSLRQTNDFLMEENARLREMIPESFVQNSRQVFFENDTLYRQRYTYVPARVIRSTFDRRSNYIVIDKGSKDGIEKDMGVITSKGVVGIVHSVSAHYASVISLLHKDIRISGRILRNGYVGTFRWDKALPEEASLNEIPAHVDLVAGDTVVSSGYSLMFPAGIPLGMIQDFYLPEGDYFYEITLRISTPFRQLSHVYVVKDLDREELNRLNLPENE